MQHIKLVCFDLDDTLWPARPTIEAAEALFYRELQWRAPALCQRFDPDALRQYRLAHLQQQPALRHQISLWRQLSLQRALEETGHGSASEGIAAEVFATFLTARQQVQLFEHCELALASLSQQVTLIGLTNGNADLARIPAGQYFHAYYRAEELGASKPAPDLFQAALAKVGCRADEAVHIGDHPDDDIRGAKQVGMFAIQAKLIAPKPETSPLADGHFEDWRGLLPLLAELEQRISAQKHSD